MSAEDDGFTLVELLVTMAILMIIMVPLGGAVIASLQSAAADDRLRDSSTEQLSNAYLSRDVASAKTISAAPGCAGVTGTVVSFRWTDPGRTADVQRAADWAVIGSRLVRVVCVLGQPGQTQRVGGTVASASCVATPSCFAAAPRTVTLRVVQPAPDNRVVNLNGTRRAS